MEVNGPFIYFTIPLFGGIPITQTTVSSLAVMLILVLAGRYLGKDLEKRPGTRQVLAEKLVLFFQDLVEETMGAHNVYWTPYIGALFLSSILGTLIGMTGFLRSTTADLSTTLVWAVMTSVLVWYNNIRVQGLWGWLKGFADPIPVMLPMNIVSEIAQPISMAFRHFGNIMGGGVLTSMLYAALAAASAGIIGLIRRAPYVAALVVLALGAGLLIYGFRQKKLAAKLFGGLFALFGFAALMEELGAFSGMPVLALGIPAVLSLYFDVFSALVQALVFSLLTMVYVGAACPPEGESN